MKAKRAFIAVVILVLGLLGVVAWLTPILFDLSIPARVPASPGRATPASATAPAPPPQVTRVDIVVPPAVEPVRAPRPTPPPPPLARSPRQPTPGDATPAAAETAQAAFQKPGIGTIASIRGTASATDSAMRRRSLTLDARVFPNEVIETSARAKLQIRLDDGSELLVSENSHLILDHYVFDRQNVERTGFVMRAVSGFCRVVTGAIAEINPDRFKVQTRLSTIGIRGCDLCVKPTGDVEEVYVLSLAPQKMIRVETTSDGTALRNILTGKEIPVEAARRVVFDVTEPQTMIAIAPGRAPESKAIPGDKFREILRESSPLPATRHEVIQKPDSAVLMPQSDVEPSSTQPRRPQ
ncbi:MAG: FecR domain-containing protein [Verrucomicrobiota bacterium]|nr:FecR domain-containing protein [Verrucomicrobiota bacterium]